MLQHEFSLSLDLFLFDEKAVYKCTYSDVIVFSFPVSDKASITYVLCTKKIKVTWQVVLFGVHTISENILYVTHCFMRSSYIKAEIIIKRNLTFDIVTPFVYSHSYCFNLYKLHTHRPCTQWVRHWVEQILGLVKRKTLALREKKPKSPNPYIVS